MRLLIVDDHDLFRTGLRALLEEDGFEVREASSGHAALLSCRSFTPDVVVMDVNMPGISGVETTRRLLAERPANRILMLTVNEADEEVLEAVHAGAAGYLLKDAPLEEIVAGVHAVGAGEAAIAPRVGPGLLAAARSAAPAVERPPAPALTAREREVLELLAAGRDNLEIGRRLHMSPSTVKSHVSKLLGRLRVENRVQAATYAIRHGLVEDSVSVEQRPRLSVHAAR